MVQMQNIISNHINLQRFPISMNKAFPPYRGEKQEGDEQGGCISISGAHVPT